MTVSAHGMLYVVACVLFPVAWGLLVVWASNRLEPFLTRHWPPADRPPGGESNNRDHPLEPPPLEYHI
ncbi:MAG TPA: hypothetical protein VFJ58_09405 [Armatimonadota bacterium]|nr:hypothetical protein [Armatimonadota bacterium]